MALLSGPGSPGLPVSRWHPSLLSAHMTSVVSSPGLTDAQVTSTPSDTQLRKFPPPGDRDPHSALRGLLPLIRRTTGPGRGAVNSLWGWEQESGHARTQVADTPAAHTRMHTREVPQQTPVHSSARARHKKLLSDAETTTSGVKDLTQQGLEAK